MPTSLLLLLHGGPDTVAVEEGGFVLVLPADRGLGLRHGRLSPAPGQYSAVNGTTNSVGANLF